MSELRVLAEGKTKIIFADPHNPGMAIKREKPVVTWGDEHSASMPGKDIQSTTTNTAIMRILKADGWDVAFVEQISPTDTWVVRCAMIPVEVVVRFVNVPKGSYAARHPEVPHNHRFEVPVVEGFLKTKDGVFKGMLMPGDDPLITRIDIENNGIWVNKAKNATEPDIFVPAKLLDLNGIPIDVVFMEMYDTARGACSGGQRAFARLGWKVKDVKIEFGLVPSGNLLIADVWDNDSHRIDDPQGVERSKQRIRDGETPEVASASYQMVADAARQLTYVP